MAAFKFVFVLLAVFLNSCTSFESVAYLRVLKNKQIVNHVIFSVKTLKESQCLYECSQRNDCGSVNYHAEHKHCILNSHISDKYEEESSIVDSTGWKFFEKSKTDVENILKKSQSSSKLLEKDIYISHAFQPIKNHLVKTFPIQPINWEVSLDVVLSSAPKDWTTVFRFKNTTDEVSIPGYRIPALFAFKDKLWFTFFKNSHPNVVYSYAIQLHTKVSLKIMQHQCEFCQARIKIYINNAVVYNEVNSTPRTFENVKCYLSGPRLDAAPVTISNFAYVAHP